MAFQLLAPTFTNNSACDATALLLTAALLALLALSYVLASFTDSLRGPDGCVYYALATPRGLWLLDYPPPGASAPPPPDTSRYRLRAIDGGPLRLPPHCRHQARADLAPPRVFPAKEKTKEREGAIRAFKKISHHF
uniref:Uncharacterized protein n=1 Tax=Oryza meridionalis TaxID=40149 RepID=A0A0E0D3U5_9ORYZ